MTGMPDRVAQVRLLIGDQQATIFTDDEIAVFCGMYADPRRAAARALVTIATTEALLSKKITTQDLSVDGPAVAASLLAQAKDLRAEADADRQDTEWSLNTFDPAGRPRRRPELTGRGWAW